MEYLGIRVTHNDVKYMNRKIKDITNMNSPTSLKEVREFIGVINYYRNSKSCLKENLEPGKQIQ